MPKTFNIEKNYDGRSEVITGTLEELKKYFGYTLEVGRSWNRKINDDPKTINSFIKNLQMSYEEKEANCYKRTFVKLLK